MNSNITSIIKSFSLFQKLEHDALDDIAKLMNIETFPNNATIITQGDLGDKIYFIASGTNQAYTLDKYGNEIILADLNAGDHFGELALLGNGFRTCFIRATSVSTLFSLTKSNFDDLIKKHSSISLALNSLLSYRLAETLNLIKNKKNTHVILLISNDFSAKHLNEFISYFSLISPRPIHNMESSNSLQEMQTTIQKLDNHYVLLKHNPLKSTFEVTFANTIVNFNEESATHFSLPPNSSSWKIGHIVRRITKKTIGIALCSGGAPAASHLGVLKTFEKENIPLDFIVGSSSGALFGACFAFGISYKHVIESIIKESKSSLLKKIIFNISPNFSGLIKSAYYKNLFKNSLGDKLIEEAHIPFAAVASDLYSGKTVVIKSGNVVDALVASNAAPIILEPILSGDKLLVDGVATAPLPTQVLIDEKIDIKIAVPISQLDINIGMKKNPKLLTVYLRSRAMMAEEMLRNNSSLADVIIEPNIKGIKILDWAQFENTIERGEEAAKIAIKRIKNLLSSKL